MVYILRFHMCFYILGLESLFSEQSGQLNGEESKPSSSLHVTAGSAESSLLPSLAYGK